MDHGAIRVDGSNAVVLRTDRTDGTVGTASLGLERRPFPKRPRETPDNAFSQTFLERAGGAPNDHSELSGVPIIPKNQFVAAGMGATRVVIHRMLSQAYRVSPRLVRSSRSRRKY